MRQYIAITYHALWNVIVNGNEVVAEPIEILGQPKPPKAVLPAAIIRNQKKGSQHTVVCYS